jgi:pantothenate synthetase
MSSRNEFLTAEDRWRALTLSRSLKLAAELFQAGERDVAKLRRRMLALFDETPEVTIEYLTLVDPDQMHEVSQARSDSVAIIAARVGNVRLIDNCILGQPAAWASKS